MTERRRAAHVRRAAMLAVALALPSLALRPALAAVSARAWVDVHVQFRGDADPDTFTFGVTNTSEVEMVGSVKISRPSTVWQVVGCPGGPAGWTALPATKSGCEYRSAPGPGGDLAPGATASFRVAAVAIAGATTRTSSWKVRVDQDDRVATGGRPSKRALPGWAGLATTAYAVTGPLAAIPTAGAALDAWTTAIGWTPPANAARIRILRDQRLLDEFAAAAGATYTDRLLWPRTTYDYMVIATAADGRAAAVGSTSVVTPDPAGAFARPYASTSFWNTPIASDARPHPNSAAMMAASVLAFRVNANLANSDKWGISVAHGSGATPTWPIACVRFDCATEVSFRIPRYAVPALGTDRHLAVLDPAGAELDMWRSAHSASAGWSAGSRYVTSSTGWGAHCAEGRRCSGAVASGFAALGGVVRPEEIAQGRIDHALALTVPVVRKSVVACPATNTDGRSEDPAALPMGARLQLDPSFDVAAQPWPRWKKTIAVALQRYGAYLADTGGSVAVRAEATLSRGYDAWSKAGAPTGSPSLADLPWDRVRVIEYREC